MSELDDIRSKRAAVRAQEAALLAQAHEAIMAEKRDGELAIQRKRLAREQARLEAARKIAGVPAPAPESASTEAPKADAPKADAPAPKDAEKSAPTKNGNS